MFESKMDELRSQPLEGRLPPDESLISELEEHLGATLPADFRQFLASFAGVAASATCPIKEPSPCGTSATIEHFYGFMPEELGYLSLAENSDDAEGAPVTIPIAEGAFSSQIFLILQGPLTGATFFHDADQRAVWPDEQFHQLYPDLHPSISQYLADRRSGKLPKKPAGMENFYLLADSFTEFLMACEYWDLYGEQE